MLKPAVVAGFDSDTGPSQHHQELLLKRQRMDEPSKALAHALLETVRQALDDDAGDANVLTSAVHATVGSNHAGRRAPRSSGFPGVESPLCASGAVDQHQYPDPDQDPVAYVRVDGSQRHEAGAVKRGRKWPTLQGPVEDPRQAFVYGALPPQTFKLSWMHDPATGPFPPVTLLEQQEALAAVVAAASGAPAQTYYPHHAETPSHGSTHTNVEASDAWEQGVGKDAGGAADLAEYGVVDRPEQTSTDDGNEGPVHRKKHGSPKAGIPGGPCAHCGTTESPQWRRPLTKKVVLCNACGIYFSRHHSLPKRKKLAGGNSHMAQRSGKAAAAQAPHVRQQAPLGTSGGDPSIVCEEELAVEEEDRAVQPTAVGAAYGTDPMAAAPHALCGRPDEAAPAGLVPWGRQTAPAEGLAASASQPVRERVALSLPLMTSLPVVGGINALVQTFLNPNLANP